LKTWTHLTGVFDQPTNTISLYVNGRLQGAPVTLPTSADAQVTDGLLEFGRNSAPFGTYNHYLQGRVDEVSVWQRALTTDEIVSEDALPDAAGQPSNELVADWDPNGASGTVLNDTVSLYGRSLSLSGGASLDGQAIVLDGTSGAGSSPGPIVDGTASFTASVLVDADSAALADKPIGYTAQVIGQRSANGSSWGVWYQLNGKATEPDPDGGDDITVPRGKWYFGRLTADGTFDGVSSDSIADLGSPVRLTGTYDAPSGEVHFFVGSQESGADTGLPYAADAGSGAFTAGDGQAAGESSWGHYLPGRISDIRLWAGAMSWGQIDSMFDS
jgi:hypothetical protein